jgi:hypothetical protein
MVYYRAMIVVNRTDNPNLGEETKRVTRDILNSNTPYPILAMSVNGATLDKGCVRVSFRRQKQGRTFTLNCRTICFATDHDRQMAGYGKVPGHICMVNPDLVK